jgi:hypothetical protein
MDRGSQKLECIKLSTFAYNSVHPFLARLRSIGVKGEPPETEADWRRWAAALRQLHRLTRDWPQRPGWRSSTGLLQAETGTKIDL